MPAKSGRGWFITFEGGEGTGKSTQIKLLARALRADGFDVYLTREPGGSIGGEAVRHVLLSGAAESFGPEMEAFLFSAARSDHVETVIKPRLLAGTTVLCDRFIDSTRVYQGGAIDPVVLRRLEAVASEDCWPDITVVLDLDPAKGMKRAHARRGGDEAPDRFEKEAMERHERWRSSYLDIARDEPERCVVVAATGKPSTVHGRVLEAVRDRMARASPGWLNHRWEGAK